RGSEIRATMAPAFRTRPPSSSRTSKPSSISSERSSTAAEVRAPSDALKHGRRTTDQSMKGLMLKSSIIHFHLTFWNGIGGLAGAGLVALFIRDRYYSTDNILRNFPVIGHLRY